MLGWAPDLFWRSTPREFLDAFAGWKEANASGKDAERQEAERDYRAKFGEG